MPLLIQECRFASLWCAKPRPSTVVTRASRTSSFNASLDVIGVRFHRWIGLLALAWIFRNWEIVWSCWMAGSSDLMMFSNRCLVRRGILQVKRGICRPPWQVLAWKKARGVSLGRQSHVLAEDLIELSSHFKVLVVVLHKMS